MDDTQIREKLAHIWPEVVGLVITKRDGKVNACPINYQAISTVYEKPLTVCIGLSNDGYTLESVLNTGEFTYAYPSQKQIEPTLYCGTVSGRETDKLRQTAFVFEKSKRIAPPLLKGAVANHECRVLHHYNAGTFTVVIAEILEVHNSSKSRLDKIYNLGSAVGDQPGNYGIIDSVTLLQKGREPSLGRPKKKR